MAKIRSWSDEKNWVNKDFGKNMMNKKAKRSRRPVIGKRPDSKKKTNQKKDTNPEHYVSRDLSWLMFNERVLHEDIDKRTLYLKG